MKLTFAVAALLLPVHAFATMMVFSPPTETSTTTIFPNPGGAYVFADPSFGQFTITGTGLISGNGRFGLGPFDQITGWGGNGTWAPGFFWFGTNQPGGQVIINLGGLYASAGGFINYDPSGIAYIRVLNSAMNVLEEYNLIGANVIDTPGATNQGAFRGISRTEADIQYLVLGGTQSVMHSITVEAGAAPVEVPGGDVPEPATIGAGILGLLMTVIAARRR